MLQESSFQKFQKTTQLDIGIEETNAGIGIPAPIVSVRYRPKKNAGLRRLSPVEEHFRQRCCIVRHFGIYIYRQIGMFLFLHVYTQTHVLAPCPCPCVHAACPCTGCKPMLLFHVHNACPRPCSIDLIIQHGHRNAAWSWTCRIDMDMQHGYGNAARK